MDVEDVQAQAQLVRQKNGNSLMETANDQVQARSVHGHGTVGEVEDPQVQGVPVHENGKVRSSARSSGRRESHEILTRISGRDAARITLTVSATSTKDEVKRISSCHFVLPLLPGAGKAEPFYHLSWIRKTPIYGRKGRMYGSRSHDWERSRSVDARIEGVQNNGLDLEELQQISDASYPIRKEGSIPNPTSFRKKRSGSCSDVPFVLLETDDEGESDSGYKTP